MNDYDKRLFAYQMAMALARSMRSKGLISAKEYAKIDTIIAKNTAYLRVVYSAEIPG